MVDAAKLNNVKYGIYCGREFPSIFGNVTLWKDSPLWYAHCNSHKKYYSQFIKQNFKMILYQALLIGMENLMEVITLLILINIISNCHNQFITQLYTSINYIKMSVSYRIKTSRIDKSIQAKNSLPYSTNILYIMII